MRLDSPPGSIPTPLCSRFTWVQVNLYATRDRVLFKQRHQRSERIIRLAVKKKKILQAVVSFSLQTNNEKNNNEKALDYTIDRQWSQATREVFVHGKRHDVVITCTLVKGILHMFKQYNGGPPCHERPEHFCRTTRSQSTGLIPF